MHQESGFLRIKPGSNQVSMMVSHNFGVTSIGGESVTLTSRDGRSPIIVREFHLDGANLKQIVSMETSKTPLTKHLEVTYSKVER